MIWHWKVGFLTCMDNLLCGSTWKLSGDRTNMKLKKKVTKDVASENNIWVDFPRLQEVVKLDDNGNPTDFVMNEDRPS